MSKEWTLEQRHALDREEAEKWTTEQNSARPAYMTRDIATESRRLANTAAKQTQSTPTKAARMAKLLAPFVAAGDRGDADAMFKEFEAVEPELLDSAYRAASKSFNAVFAKAVAEAEKSGGRKNLQYTQDVHDVLFRSIKTALARVGEESTKTLMLLQIHRTRRLALEKRIEELESKIASMPAVSYAGVHQDGNEYTRGMLVTHDGSLWHAQTRTYARPGHSEDWRLAVKRGANGRDAR